MKPRARFDRSRAARRGAFTLVELIVSTAIVAALVALSASATVKYIEVQQYSNTQSALDRTQSQLNKAWSKVKDQAYQETIPSPIYSWIQQNLAGSDSTASVRVRVLYVKLKLRQAFPMSFDEVFNNGVPAAYPLPPLQADMTYLSSLGITGSSTVTAPYESSACLLMALQRGVSGAGINASDLTGGGATGSFTTPNGGNLPYLTDAWNRPIYFTRVPAGNLSLNPATAQSVTNTYTLPWGTVTCYSQPGVNDPGDPQGYLQYQNWAQMSGPSGAFGAVFTALTKQVLATGNSSYKLAPMVASGGSINWSKKGTTPPFDPITFSTTPGNGSLFSNP